PRGQITDGHPDLRRLTAILVGRTGDRHDPGESLDREVVTGLVAARPVRTEARDREPYQAGVEGLESLVGETQALEPAGALVLDEDVAPLDEAPHDPPTGITLE